MTTEGDVAYLSGEIDKLNGRVGPLTESVPSLASRVADLEDWREQHTSASPWDPTTLQRAGLVAGAVILAGVYPERFEPVIAAFERMLALVGGQ